MKYPFIFAFCLSLFSLNETKAQEAFYHDDFERSIRVTDPNGNTFTNPGMGVEGSRFLSDNWKSSSLVLATNAVFDNVKIKLDLQSQELYFLNTKNNELIIEPGLIKEFVLKDSFDISNKPIRFKSGYPAIDKKSAKNFYQILSEGKITFLESLEKSVYEVKNEMTGDKSKEYRMYDDYYVFINNSMQMIRKNKNFIYQIMHDKEQAIDAFVKSKNLSFRSIQDIMKIIDYYNTL